MNSKLRMPWLICFHLGNYKTGRTSKVKNVGIQPTPRKIKFRLENWKQIFCPDLIQSDNALVKNSTKKPSYPINKKYRSNYAFQTTKLLTVEIEVFTCVKLGCLDFCHPMIDQLQWVIQIISLKSEHSCRAERPTIE